MLAELFGAPLAVKANLLVLAQVAMTGASPFSEKTTFLYTFCPLITV
jgi:hypothetical protein